MKIKDIPLSIIDWTNIPSLISKGEKGKAGSKTFESGNIRVRIVKYSAGYESDHWCEKGHILFVLEGVLSLAIKRGKKCMLHKGMSFHAGEGMPAHKVYSRNGAKVFIVD